MKYLSLLVSLFLLMSCSSIMAEGIPLKLKFDFDWKFNLGDRTGANEFNFDDSQWRTLDVPHDFSIEQPFDSLNKSGQGGGYAYGGIGWYRKHFVLSSETKDKIVEIQFNGVYRNSDVWINGHHLGFRPYGYSSFCYDLTPFLNEPGKENTLAVRVNTADEPNSRWYTGSGIYRHVWLLVTDKVHFIPGGVFVRTKLADSEKALISASFEVKNDDAKVKNCTITSTLYDKTGKVVSTQQSEFRISQDSFIVMNQYFKVLQPELWSVDFPNLYHFESVLESNGKVLDKYEHQIGIRTFGFDPNKGFSLNGKHIKLKGVNNHHDGGPLGAACFDYTFERQLNILKGMGCNALRMSHNPPAPELLDCADSMGFVVIDEIFDEWKNGKREFGYAKFFDEWYEKDVADWIRRDRNHPSVIAWSLGNEVVEQNMDIAPLVLKQLIEVASLHDTTRLFTSACNEIIADNKSGFANLLGIVGYNYQEPNYEVDHKTYPNRIIYGSETAIYPYHPGNGFPLRSYEQWVTGQTEDYVAGEFLWTGFDYIGESGIGNGGASTEPWNYWPQWPWRSAVCGVVDLCGFEKPGYWFRKALWGDEPFVYIAVPTDLKANDREICPFWGWPDVLSQWNCAVEGEKLTVQVYTNCPEVELLSNGKSLGKKYWDIRKEAFLTWNVPYSKGKIEAIGTLRNGQHVEYKIETVDEPSKIICTPDRTTINATRQDVSYVKVEVVDGRGNVVPFASNVIDFEINGVGKIAAVGNGNPQSHTSFKGDKMETFNGQCLVIVQSTDKTGELVLKAKSIGLEPTVVIIEVK
jgi:beta-galactosidase